MKELSKRTERMIINSFANNPLTLIVPFLKAMRYPPKPDKIEKIAEGFYIGILFCALILLVIGIIKHW